MESFAVIRAALGRVRRRLVAQSAVEAALYVAAVAAVAAVAIPVAARAVSLPRAPSIAGALLGVGLIGIVAAIARHWIRARRWRPDDRVARYLGGSDLLSSVELEGADPRAFSTELVQALAAKTAADLASLDVGRAVPVDRLRPAAITAGICAGVALLAVAAGPDAIADGWRRAVHGADSDRFAGAHTSDVPVVGDIEITMEYPGYTGRPSITLPASSGDFRTMPGATVFIETRALMPTESAKLIFDGADPDTAIALMVDGDALSTAFIVTEASAYRFFVQPESGPPLVEAAPHAIEIEPDEAPKLELYAPADELDVEGRKRIELAYTAEDDYGLTEIALVWDAGAGTKPGRKVVLGSVDQRRAAQGQRRAAQGHRRAAQGRLLWDLAEVDLRPGARVEYYLEATDNDDVLGPNLTRSKSYYLRVFSPRERHEQLIDRQEQLFERMVKVLGARLVVNETDQQTHQLINKEAHGVVVDLGGVIAALEDDDVAGRDLLTALRDMRKRLDKLARAEAKLLASKKWAARVAASDKRNVAEVEDDVLLLADWVGRQRMENVLALVDEIAERRERIAALMEEYERTGDEALLAEIDRELRALEQQLAELAQKQQGLPQDVLDQFVNLEAMQGPESMDCIGEVRRLLKLGDAVAAQQKLAECSQQLDDNKAKLEEQLAELRGERFAEEQRKLDELTGELADLIADENETAKRADEIMQRYADTAAEMLADKAKDTRAKARKIIKRLRKRIDKVPERGLTPFSKEELPVVSERLEDVQKMLDDGDLAEALAMARQAQDGLDTVEAELGADLDTGEPWSDRTGDAYNQVARAVPIARELVEELEKATPRPQDIMDRDDRRALRRLQKRQRAIRQRTDKLGERAQKLQDGGELPGGSGEAMAKGLGEASGHMERAEGRMKAGDPPGARNSARDAANALERARKESREQARPQGGRGSRGVRDEPVRIPGADEYRAPEEFREEILEAMKKDAPSGFAEQVQRYYEELIK